MPTYNSPTYWLDLFLSFIVVVAVLSRMVLSLPITFWYMVDIVFFCFLFFLFFFLNFILFLNFT